MGIGRLVRACLVTLAFLAAAAPAREAVAQANFDRPGGDYLSAPVTSGDPADCALVCERDKLLDDFYDGIFRILVTYMVENPATIGQVAHLLFVAKNLERIGDHATNVAEMVYFAATGTQMPERIKTGETP